MFRRCMYWIRPSAAATVVCLIFSASFSTSALAAKPPSNEQLFEMMKALQSRVAVLEDQNTKFQRELMEVHKGAEPARLQLASLPQQGQSRGAGEPRPMGMANTDPTSGALQPADNWSGMYWGMSFGGGVTSSRATSVLTSGEIRVSNRGEDDGAIIDLFFGINRQINSRIVVGVQVEGSLGGIDFRNIELPIGGGFIENSAEIDWMASALARTGFLISPSTMVYGLAGWTHADIDTLVSGNTNSRGFNADGITVGGGIERSISPEWTMRAEYRFTDFDVGSDTGKSGNKFSLDGDMHMGRIGFARRLGRSE